MNVLTNGVEQLTAGGRRLAVANSYAAYPPATWSPLDLGASLAGWYAPDSATYSAGRLVQLLDKSPNGRHSELLANPATGPLLLPNGSLQYEGSKASGNFNAIGFLSSVLTIPQPFTIVTRARIEGNAAGPLATDYLFDGYDRDRVLITVNGNGTDDSEFAVGIVDSGLLFPEVSRPVWSGIWRTYTMVADGPNSAFYIDKTLVDTGNLGAVALQGLRFGVANINQHGLNGQQPESFISNSRLPLSIIEKADTYLTRWS